MKFIKSLAIAALFSLAVLADDTKQQEGKTYKSIEKERFVYGRPGDKDYGKELSADEIMEREQMWVLDLDVQKSRGFLQGFHRGLYKDYDW